MGYSQAYHLQKELLRQRANNEITDVLLLLEHPPTITIGKVYPCSLWTGAAMSPITVRVN